MIEKTLTDGSVEGAAKWLCKGGPCFEAGDRCKVLSEDCCPCTLAGNILIRQRDEIERLTTALDQAHSAIASIRDDKNREIRRLNAEVSARGTTMNDRIKLAEVMDIGLPSCGSCFGSGQITISSSFGSEMCGQCEGSGKDWPDPFTDANDCEALITHLNGLGYRIRVDWRLSENGHFVEIWKAGTTNWKFGGLYDAIARHDWKQGVCELALKVLDQRPTEDS